MTLNLTYYIKYSTHKFFLQHHLYYSKESIWFLDFLEVL
jgi:hypothetical protein